MTEETRMAVQLAVGLVFLVSTLGKARNPRAFFRGIADYEILPPALSSVAGTLVILVEAFLAFSHLTSKWITVALPVAVVTLTAFLAAVAVNLKRHRDLPCFCFGEGDERVSGRSVAQLLLLIGAELLLLVSPRLGAPVWSAVGAADLALALVWALLLLTAARWLLSLPDLLYLVKQYRCKACSQPGTPAPDFSSGEAAP